MRDLERNKAAARRFFEELWSGADLDRAGEYVSPTFYQHHPRNADEDILGPASLMTWLAQLRASLSGVRVNVNLAFAEESSVMLYLGGTGFYAPERAEPGLAVRWTTTAVLRMADGKVAEAWIISDTLGLSRQLGVLAN
jgi:predicted SnoaL-like aldol condensation-catalyzing enzyme